MPGLETTFCGASNTYNSRDLSLFVLQEFHKCFPSFDTRHAMAFYDLYRQVSEQHR